MSTFCQRSYHRKYQRRGVGGQKKPKSCEHNQCMSNSGRCAFKAEYSPTILFWLFMVTWQKCVKISFKQREIIISQIYSASFLFSGLKNLGLKCSPTEKIRYVVESFQKNFATFWGEEAKYFFSFTERGR